MTYAIATLMLAVLAVTVPRDGACARDIGDSLMDMLDIRTIENRTTATAAADYRIPGYMYKLYRDTSNQLQRYDLIRSISPRTGNIFFIVFLRHNMLTATSATRDYFP